jgi:hypothetical protein
VVQVAQPTLMLGDEPAAPRAAPAPVQEIRPAPFVAEEVAGGPMPAAATRPDSTESDPPSQTARATGAGELPRDILAALREDQARLLAELARRWKQQGAEPGSGMHRCPQGAAFELMTLGDQCDDPGGVPQPAGCNRLAVLRAEHLGAAGVPVPGGAEPDGRGNAVACFILAPHSMKRLGLS